jgi:hypothetical protein
MNRFLLLALCLGATHAASASFELALIGTNNGINRVDGDTFASLGKFGTTVIGGGVISLAIDKGRNTVYALAQNTTKGRESVDIFALNYNTGEFISSLRLGNTTTSGRSLTVDEFGRVWVASGFGLTRYLPQNNWAVSASIAGNFYGVGTATSRVVFYDGSVLRTYLEPSAGVFQNLGSVALSGAASTSNINMRDGTGLIVSGTTAARFNIDAGAPTILQFYGAPGTKKGLAFGHGNKLLGTYQDTVTPTTGGIYTQDGTSGTLFTEALTGYYGPIATVVAPEPGTLLAASAGILALVSRRRQQRPR